MSVRIRAIGRTVVIVALAAFVPIVAMYLFRLDEATLFELFICSFAVWMVWVIYSINLGQLETKETIREMQERRETMLSGTVDKE